MYLKTRKKPVNKMMDFINCGEEPEQVEQTKQPMMNWEHDFNVLVAPINKALGVESSLCSISSLVDFYIRLYGNRRMPIFDHSNNPTEKAKRRKT